MAQITAAAVKSLRERTGLPMMDCKKALSETGGDEEAAVESLRKKGIKTQETKMGSGIPPLGEWVFTLISMVVWRPWSNSSANRLPSLVTKNLLP